MSGINKILKKDQAKKIEIFLAWGSVAYVVGFVTVMLHTARLGIPVIEIIKPVYIWIGIPGAIFLFLIEWLLGIVKVRVEKAKKEFATVRNDVNELLGKRSLNKKSIADLVRICIEIIAIWVEILPLGSIFSRVFKFLQRRIVEIAERSLINFLRRVDLPQRITFIESGYRGLKISAIFGRAVGESIRILNFFVRILLIPTALIVYMVIVYPLIPQSIGGGKPISVVLIMKSEEFSQESSYINALFPVGDNPYDTSLARETVKVEILYSTTDLYYIKSPDGHVISLQKDLIEGILWNP